jgi:hypothetical protein
MTLKERMNADFPGTLIPISIATETLKLFKPGTLPFSTKQC